MAHLLGIQGECGKSADLGALQAKQAISLLRYCEILPLDLVFYEAGDFAKKAGMSNMAFVCFNRFLDISDSIEDGQTTVLENSDFEGSDLPSGVKLPKVQSVPVSC